MEWWATQPEAWEEVNKDQRPPELVIPEFRDWLKGFEASLVVTAHPIGFDYAFVSWYLWKFADENPFTNSNGALVSLDIASYIAGKYDLRLEDSKRHTMPDELKIGMPIHSHNALDDARGYGVILRNVLQA